MFRRYELCCQRLPNDLQLALDERGSVNKREFCADHCKLLKEYTTRGRIGLSVFGIRNYQRPQVRYAPHTF